MLSCSGCSGVPPPPQKWLPQKLRLWCNKLGLARLLTLVAFVLGGSHYKWVGMKTVWKRYESPQMAILRGKWWSTFDKPANFGVPFFFLNPRWSLWTFGVTSVNRLRSVAWFHTPIITYPSVIIAGIIHWELVFLWKKHYKILHFSFGNFPAMVAEESPAFGCVFNWPRQVDDSER